MTAGSSFVQTFGGSAIRPAQPSYEALTIAANQALVWPLESAGGVPYVAAVMGVTASANGLQLQMPPGNLGSNGAQAIVMNLGTDSFTVTDTAGNPICTITTTQAWVITLTDNTTTNGSWLAIQLGSTVSQAVASALAGYGLEAVGTQLWANWPTTTVSATGTIGASERSNAIVWTGATGTLQLAGIAATLGIGWFAAISNLGTGALTLETSGADTINGAGSVILQPGNSGLIVAGSGEFVTFGLLPVPLSIADGGTGATSAPAALTALGGTALGTSIFTAASAAAVLSLLGINASIFTENTVTTSQTLAAGSSGTIFVTATTGLTFTLPLTTTLTKSFVVGFTTRGYAATIAPQAADTIFGLSEGASFTLPTNCSLILVTDANGKWWPVMCGPTMTSGGGMSFAGSVTVGVNLTVDNTLTVDDGIAMATGTGIGFGANLYFNDTGSQAFGMRTGGSGNSKYFTFDASGNGNALNGSWVNGSDGRLKSDQQPITPQEGLAYCLSGLPMTYTMGGVRKAGFIAQHDLKDTARAIAISQLPNKEMKADAESPEGIQFGRDYAQDNAYTQAAIQALAAKIAELEAKLAAK
jgi:hypothetical protein